MTDVAPMIPREVWDEVQKCVAGFLANYGDDDNSWCFDNLITREILSILERRHCLTLPSSEPPQPGEMEDIIKQIGDAAYVSAWDAQHNPNARHPEFSDVLMLAYNALIESERKCAALQAALGARP